MADLGLSLVELGNIACFVDFSPDEVAGPVGEVFPVASLLNDLARRPINASKGHTWTDCLNGRFLGLTHGLIDSPRLLIRLPVEDGPGHIRTVALVRRADVNYH